MSANIFGERFLSRGKPAWWDMEGLHTFPLERQATATSILEEAGLDYVVEKWPIVASGGTRSKVIAVPNKMALVRQPVPGDNVYRTFGVCGPEYEVVQNRDLAALLDPISEKWAIETAGALGQGEKFFMTFNAGEQAVKGTDLVKKYFAVVDDKSYGRSLRFIFTPVRVVCQNTLKVGIKSATFTALVPHNAKVQETAKWRLKIIQEMEKAQEETMRVFDKMAETKLDETQTAAVIDAAFRKPNAGPKTSLAYEMDGNVDEEFSALMVDLNKAKGRLEYADERNEVFKQGTYELLEKFNDEFPQFAGTAWAAYNAVAECSDWRNGGAKVAESVLIGPRSREKERAFVVAAAFSLN